jgi:predicted dehydrogenase
MAGAQSFGANDRIQIGMIGGGARSAELSATISRLASSTIVATAATDAASRELLVRADVDAVVIAASEEGHSEIALAALREGKDVYLEVPMARTLREAGRLASAARATGRVIQIGAEAASANSWRMMRRLVAEGRIGSVVMSQGPCNSGDPVELFNAIATFSTCWPEAGSPVRVTAVADNGRFHLAADFAQGHTMILGAAAGTPMTIRGTLGALVIRRDDLLEYVPEGRNSSVLAIPVAANDATADHLGDFLAAVRSRRRPVLDAVAAMCAQAVVSLAAESCREGRTLYRNQDAMTVRYA